MDFTNQPIGALPSRLGLVRRDSSYLSIYPSIYLSIDISVYLSVCLSIYLSILSIPPGSAS